MTKFSDFQLVTRHEDPPPGTITEDRVNTIVNGAIAKVKNELTTSVKDMLTPFGDQFKTLTEGLTALQTSIAAGAPDDKKKKVDGELPPEVNLQLKQLNDKVGKQEKDLADEKKRREEAEATTKKTEKESKLRTALGQFNFASPDAAEDAFTLLQSKVDFDSDGKLVADGLPMEDFVKDYIPSKKAHLLAQTGKGGAGASAGSNKGGAGAFQIEAIKPGMSVEDQARAAGAIRQAISN